MLATFKSLALGSLAKNVPLFGPGDPLGVFNFYSKAFRSPKSVYQGMVVCYNPQTHSAAVSITGMQSVWTCIFADELLSYSFGFSETHPAREGELVLVTEITPGSQFGIVIGRIPYQWNFKLKGDRYSDPDQYHRRLYTQDEKEKRTWDRNIPAYSMPFGNPNDDSTHIATHFRPTDVYPGEFAHVNQHNCGIKGGLFSTTLLGGGASLRMSALTNAARMTCEEFIRHSMFGSFHEFHNGRYLSSERNMALYQEERFGGAAKQATVWLDDSEANVKGENQTMRPRMKELSGFFGHLYSRFCLRPDPTNFDIRVQGAGKPKEAGVSRETIDPSGQYRLSAAGMIAIERTGRIPVPVRNCYPTDKDHGMKSDPETLAPFEHSEADPCYRQLELFDRQAYDLKNQYARVDGLGLEGGDKPDYDVPQEEDLHALEDQYDPTFLKNETVKLNKFDKRRAGVYIGEDGSVIIRDAWGSEIVMLGGNVSISCAGNVMLLPGKTQLTIAGDDIVQKAQNSVDIHASEHDVRLSAARNMEILGGGDESKYSGGVIIESRGKKSGPWDGKGKGESAQVSGITLRTKSQGVVVDGQNLTLRSRKSTRVISGDEQIDGTILVGAKKIYSRANNTIATSGGASVILQNTFAAIVGKSVMAGGSSLNLDNGGKTPGMWVDGGGGASETAFTIDEETKFLEEEDNEKCTGGFDAEALKKMIFGFRTSEECGTDRPWAVGRSSGAFKMYEPAWAQVMRIYETLKNAGVDAVPYKEDAKWDNGKPFPGKEAEDSAQYATCIPVNLTQEGFNRSRETVEPRSDIHEESLKDGYLVRK